MADPKLVLQEDLASPLTVALSDETAEGGGWGERQATLRALFRERGRGWCGMSGVLPLGFSDGPANITRRTTTIDLVWCPPIIWQDKVW
jgi:hypothetical protein